MKVSYEIEWVEVAKDPVSGEACGGDSHMEYVVSRKSEAIILTKKLSKQSKINSKPVHEAFFKKLDDNNDVVGHWYYRNGKLINTMF